MEYPFRYDKPKIGDTCWFLSQEGPIKSIIVDKHDHYFNQDPKIYERGPQKDYLIDYWIDNYKPHGLIFGEDLFETEEECIELINKEIKLECTPPIVFTNGCFDIIHSGHIKLLKYASSLGQVMVGLNSDKSIRKIKPNRPIQNEKDRKEILESIKYVNVVTLFDEETPIELLKIIHPDILIKGGDWKESDDITFDYVRSYGGEVVFYDYIPQQSTTNIINKILKMKG